MLRGARIQGLRTLFRYRLAKIRSGTQLVSTAPARLPRHTHLRYTVSMSLKSSSRTSLDLPEKTYAFVSLGCPKNLVDSERMLGKLAQAGYALTPNADGADVVVVNTCGFIEPARQESLAVINEMLDLKKKGRVGKVVVAGCLAERKKDELLQVVPGVDHIVGVFGREDIADVVHKTLTSPKRQRGAGTAEQRSLFRPAPVRALDDTARLRVTPRHYAYLKISEGCDRLCTFCAIPGMRGKHVTKPIEQVVAEARELVDDGVRELILVAQDTTYYGLDFYGRTRLAELLRELDQIDGLDWIRVLYAYPMYFTDELIETIEPSYDGVARVGDGRFALEDGTCFRIPSGEDELVSSAARGAVCSRASAAT